MHTYEGTYEVNSLVSARELTGGISAIRWINLINLSNLFNI
jgi:hypothetical protein